MEFIELPNKNSCHGSVLENDSGIPLGYLHYDVLVIDNIEGFVGIFVNKYRNISIIELFEMGFPRVPNNYLYI